jgi:Zn-dependent protease with chaperone function
MHVGTWADVLAQSIVHGFVGAVVVEALIRLWKVRSSRERLALRLLAVAGPLVLSPALVLAWPARGSDEFRERFAVFTSRHWEDVQVLGVPVFLVWLVLLAGAGAALLAMDLWPVVAPRRRAPHACAPPPPELPRAVARLAAAFGLEPAPGRYLDVPAPILFCTGVRRPTIVLSRGTLALLDAEELDAALAHELAHVAERDPAKSWGMMAARALLFFNPAAQVVARAMAREAEARADERSGAVAGRVELASALLKLYRATHRVPSQAGRLRLAGAVAEPFRRARTLEVESRCRRLLEPGEPPRPLVGARVALAAGGLAALLVMVA